MIKSFKQVISEQRREMLTEAIRYSDFPKAASLIQRYLAKYVGKKTFYYPTPEVVSTKGQTLVGIRFFLQGNKSIRLNWKRGTLNKSLGIVSLDYWNGTKTVAMTPNTHIAFEEDQSMATVLPFVKDFLLGKVKRGGVYISDAVENQRVAESLESDSSPAPMLTEARLVPAELVAKTIDNMLTAFSQGDQITAQGQKGGNATYGPLWHQAKKSVKELYPQLFNVQPGSGTREQAIIPSDVRKIDKMRLLNHVMGTEGVIEFTVEAGRPEQIEVALDSDDLDRMTYEEQLESLKTGMTLLMSNATNAIFVGGRGGTGKTVTVQDMLHSRGLEDGNGYFKVSGSASASGIYRILYEHRNEIILFDDCDTALVDSEGRNLFKAAADTKKIRKVSWMKGGKNYVDPADMPEEGEDGESEEGGDGKLPRYFDFKGKIIFISNLPLGKLDPDGALRTRGYVMNVDPTDEELYDFMEKIMMKIDLDTNYVLTREMRKEVVDVLRARKIPTKSSNLRSLERGLKARAAIEEQHGDSRDWKKFVQMYA